MVNTLLLILNAFLISHALPNFVFIIADDLGWNDVGFHSATNAYTPNIDKLVFQDALEFTRFYVYPKCSPTRTSFMTGRYSHTIQMQHNVGLTERMACGIEPSVDTMYWSERLKVCRNYNNYYIGKWHMGYFKWKHTPLMRGFDSFKGFYRGQIDYFNFTFLDILDWQKDFDLTLPTKTEKYSTDVFADEAIEILQNMANENDETPFSMVIQFNAPHAPIHAVAGYKKQAQNNGIFAETGDTQRMNYISMITAMDARIGDIVNTLKTETINNEPIWDNTWVWFLSDNGPVILLEGSSYPLRGAKSTVFEGGVRVPAFITGGLLPDNLAGKWTPELIHITDIYKTICTQSFMDCSDAPLDGKDLSHLIENTGRYRGDSREIILNVDNVGCFAEYNDNEICGGIIRNIDGVTWKAVIGNEIEGPSENKFGWNQLKAQEMQNNPTVDCGAVERPNFDEDFLSTNCASNNKVCLFNLSEDPCEYNDLSGIQDPFHQQILESLMQKLQKVYDKQSQSFFTFCDSPDAAVNYAIDNNGWLPWAEWYYNDDTFSLQNTKPFIDQISCV